MKIDKTNTRVLVVVVNGDYEDRMFGSMGDYDVVLGSVDVTNSVQISNGVVSFLPIRITIEGDQE